MVAPDPLKPTRQELQQIAGNNFRVLRAFERLFEKAGQESPDDIANIIDRLDSYDYGGVTMSDNATETSISAALTPVKINGSTTPLSGLSNFTASTGNRLVYTGEYQNLFSIYAALNYKTDRNVSIAFYVAKNGNVISETQRKNRTNPFGDTSSTVLNAGMVLSQNDYIELFVENRDSIANVTVIDLTFIANRA